MKFLLSYDFCAHCLRRAPWALEALGSVPIEQVAVSTVTVGDLMISAMVGAQDEKDAESRVKALRAFLGPIQQVGFGATEVANYAACAAFLIRAGHMADPNEVMELAVADAHHLVVVTEAGGTTSHIADRLRDIKQVDWAKPQQIKPRVRKKS